MEKHYEVLKIEEEMQQFWKENNIYSYDSTSTKEIYSIDTPPPTVSGQLHIGHIFSYTQAEMIARFKRMQGYNVFYPFGFDDNGLPTERLVEKDYDLLARNLSRDEMTTKCREVARKYEDEFKALWQSLGLSVDWDLQYETVNPVTTRISQRLFLDLVKQGKAYIKEASVLWCTTCQTSIAQAELETVEKETSFNYIPFEVDGEKLMVATTRPELLYGVVALFINTQDKRYKKYIGRTAITPLYNQEIPILGDEEVEVEKGTGIVMCATFGDVSDTKWYEKYELPYKKVILSDGTINKEISFIGGLEIEKAREIIIKELRDRGLLMKQEMMTHLVATHERCGKTVEIIPSKQWYIDILTDKERYLQAADEINWYPSIMKNRYISWVQNLKWDWCISRQRYFGVPIPIWYCKECGAIILPHEKDLPVNPLEDSPKTACRCGHTTFIPETAVMDTWATSSITPQINRKWQEQDERLELKLPMGLRTQAHEIIRTWAFYTIVRSLYHTGKLPWKDIMISGFVLAKKGEKISKSKNNSKLSPKEIITKHSADALRYWAAHARLGSDTFFSEEELLSSKRFMNKLWNASKFSLMHLQDFDKSILLDVNKPDLLPVDEWILERINQTMIKATKLLDQYEIGLARQEIDDLFWKDFCDDYLEIAKDRLYKPSIHSEAGRRAAQYTLYYALLNILKLYAIYIPHQTEYIYQSFFKKYEGFTSLHQTLWKIDEEINQGILDFGTELKKVIGEIRKYKSENNLSMKAELKEFTIFTNEGYIENFKKESKDIKACGSIENLQIKLIQD
nr:valine--tRNA ligase [uncultured Niameybacter sp.]